MNSHPKEKYYIKGLRCVCTHACVQVERVMKVWMDGYEPRLFLTQLASVCWLPGWQFSVSNINSPQMSPLLSDNKESMRLKMLRQINMWKTTIFLSFPELSFLKWMQLYPGFSLAVNMLVTECHTLLVMSCQLIRTNSALSHCSCCEAYNFSCNIFSYQLLKLESISFSQEQFCFQKYWQSCYCIISVNSHLIRSEFVLMEHN